MIIIVLLLLGHVLLPPIKGVIFLVMLVCWSVSRNTYILFVLYVVTAYFPLFLFLSDSDVDVIKSINCEWVYEESGVNIECGLNRVVSGQCGSRLTNACNDSDDTHGAYCCDIRERNVTKTADHYDDYYDEY